MSRGLAGFTCPRGAPVEEMITAKSSLMGVPRSVGGIFAGGPMLTHHRQVAWNLGSGTTAPTSHRTSNLPATL